MTVCIPVIAPVQQVLPELHCCSSCFLRVLKTSDFLLVHCFAAPLARLGPSLPHVAFYEKKTRLCLLFS